MKPSLSKAIVKDIIGWDIRNWSQALSLWTPVVSSFDDKATVLVIGDRHGGLSLWMALQGFKVICSDYVEPSEHAKTVHRTHAVNNLITYQRIDIFDIPFEENTFDLILCKSVIGGLKKIRSDNKTRSLENQKLAVDECRRVLKKNGYFLGAENVSGSWMHQLIRKLKNDNRDVWRYMTMTEVDYLFSKFSMIEQKTHGFIGTFYAMEFLNAIFGAIDRFCSHLLPLNFQYITFIIARK